MLRFLLLFTVLAAPAAAAEISAKMFGHDVAVAEQDGEQRLTIDGREALRNYRIDFDEIGMVAGMPVIVGTSATGGNACPGSPFILSFPKGANPRLDGPLDNCNGAAAELKADRIDLTSSALPGRDGAVWTWTAGEGIRETGTVAFKPDASRGWAELRERTATHPTDLFGYGEIAAEIEALAGSSKPLVLRTLNGVGSAKFDGDWFVGWGCKPHDCFSEATIIVASLADRRIYLAWKPAGEKIVVNPVVGEWPKKARAELKEWASQWN